MVRRFAFLNDAGVFLAALGRAVGSEVYAAALVGYIGKSDDGLTGTRAPAMTWDFTRAGDAAPPFRVCGIVPQNSAFRAALPATKIDS